MAKNTDMGKGGPQGPEREHEHGFEHNPEGPCQPPLGQQVKDWGAPLQQQAGNFATKASEESQHLMEGAKGTVSTLERKASEKTKEFMEGAKGTLSALEQKADDAVGAVGCQMKNLAGSLREQMPHEGMIGSAAGAVADTLEGSAHYLEEHDLRAMAKDVVGIVRTYPIPSVLIGVALGFLLGRRLRS